LKTVLPCHYINPDDPDVTAFEAYLAEAKACGERVPESIVLKPGDWLELSAEEPRK
jgi:hypothetical protein